MSLQCGMPALSYDFVLRVEEMAAWYEPFVRLLGLEKVALPARPRSQPIP